MNSTLALTLACAFLVVFILGIVAGAHLAGTVARRADRQELQTAEVLVQATEVIDAQRYELSLRTRQITGVLRELAAQDAPLKGAVIPRGQIAEAVRALNP